MSAITVMAITVVATTVVAMVIPIGATLMLMLIPILILMLILILILTFIPILSLSASAGAGVGGNYGVNIVAAKARFDRAGCRTSCHCFARDVLEHPLDDPREPMGAGAMRHNCYRPSDRNAPASLWHFSYFVQLAVCFLSQSSCFPMYCNASLSIFKIELH